MCIYKDNTNGVCNIRCKPCNNCKTTLNTRAFRGFKWRSPNKWEKYIDPYANLMYAVLLRAAVDAHGYREIENHKHNDGKDAIAWLEVYGRAYMEILNDERRYISYEKTKKDDGYTKEHK